jgi:hypothetical protein
LGAFPKPLHRVSRVNEGYCGKKYALVLLMIP